MVVTVEPGIYFSTYALEHFYLPSPIHSRYIDIEVVQRYLLVGGVRIEDDILITSTGYDNLTTAPKGDAMFDIIRNGKSTKSSLSSYRQSSAQQKQSQMKLPLLRAPGLSNLTAEPALRPLARAATMPPEFKEHRSLDCKDFEENSLFSNFKRSMTTDDKIQHWRQTRAHAASGNKTISTDQSPLPVCGQLHPGTRHVYLSGVSHCGPPAQCGLEHPDSPTCKPCMILVQTLDRLRHNLVKSEHNLLSISTKTEPDRLMTATLTGGKSARSEENKVQQAQLPLQLRAQARREKGTTTPCIKPGGPDFEPQCKITKETERNKSSTPKFPRSDPGNSLHDNIVSHNDMARPRKEKSRVTSPTLSSAHFDFDAVIDSIGNTTNLPIRRVKDQFATTTHHNTQPDSPVQASILSVEQLRKEVDLMNSRILALANQEQGKAHRAERATPDDNRTSTVQDPLPAYSSDTLWQQSEVSAHNLSKRSNTNDRPLTIEDAIAQGRRLERSELHKRLERRRREQAAQSPFASG